MVIWLFFQHGHFGISSSDIGTSSIEKNVYIKGPYYGNDLYTLPLTQCNI